MTEPEFIDLLVRFERGQCTTEEERLVEKWLDSPGKGRVPFKTEEQRSQIKRALYDAVLRKAGHSSPRFAEGHLPTEPKPSITRWFRTGYRIAAAVILVALAAYGTTRYFQALESARYAVVEASSGEKIVKVLLSDGSIVWLKPNSVLEYPKVFRPEGERMLTLRGEALFEVEKNPRQPFIVRAGELTATVLGTSFNIKAAHKQIEVVVLTGKVSLSSTTDEHGVVVLQDETAVYHEDSKILAKVPKPVDAPLQKAITTGTQYNMDFNNIPMSDVIQRVEGKFDVKVTTTDASLGNCVITADLTGQSLSKTLDIISAALAVSYTMDDKDVVTLEGKGCQ